MKASTNKTKTAHGMSWTGQSYGGTTSGQWGKIPMRTHTGTHAHTPLKWSYAVNFHFTFSTHFFFYCSDSYICWRWLFIFIYSFAGSHPHLLDKCYLHVCHVPAMFLGTHDPGTHVNFYWCLLQLPKGIILSLFSRVLLEEDIVPGVSDN